MCPGVQERRRHKRFHYNETVFVNDSIRAQCANISEGGLFIYSTRGLLPGSTVKVAFPAEDLSVTAVVQHVRENGVGLMFTAVKPEELEGIRAICRNAGSAQAAGRKHTVLMVEDSESVRRLNKARLSAEGFRVMEASDGLEALKILQSERPDLVLLDIHMEKMDGYKVLGFIRQKPELKDIPVIMFSSTFSAQEQSHALEAGATEFLAKMTTPPARLAEIVKEMLGK